MTEERIERVNADVVCEFQRLVKDLNDGFLENDKLIAETYARMVLIEALDLNLEAMSKDAQGAADRILDLIEAASKDC